MYLPRSILKSRKTRPHRDKQILSLWLGKYNQHHLLPPWSIKKQVPEMRDTPFLKDRTVAFPPRSSSLTEKTWGTVTRLSQKRKKKYGRGFLRRKFPSSNINSISSLSYDQKRNKIESHCLQGCFMYMTGLSGVGRVSQSTFEFSNKKTS